eukprot:TRINITY_DN3729_c0_g1_i1.p1 TRINITY_DN3729_c0_g1~~TRINITY_DN3729_c0_g1_i1.p1  ORF type:complete len:409 (+),score=161.12 TRINITY_DN3729_c0_g1_i1:149-1375(+)
MNQDDGKQCAGVQLGFLSKMEAVSSYPFLFPSKVGGKPIWLNPQTLPTPSWLICTSCKKPLPLLLQVYAPLEEFDHAYHRTLFVFCCKSGSCLKKGTGIKVLRSQLPKENAFYPAEDIDEEDDEARETALRLYSSKASKGCAVCGLSGDKICSQCRSVHYCDRAHQAAHWPSHKAYCTVYKNCGGKATPELLSQLAAVPEKVSSEALFAEWEILTEDEPAAKGEEGAEGAEDSDDSDDDEDIEGDKEEQEQDEEWSQIQAALRSELGDPTLLKNLSTSGVADSSQSVSSLNQLSKDAAFTKFVKRTARANTQIMRYDRDADPLLISSSGLPPSEADLCTSCNAPTVFEFQILPQLLYHLHVDVSGEGEGQKRDDAVDWGVLLVYTCSKSCNKQGLDYTEEIVYKQEIQ